MEYNFGVVEECGSTASSQTNSMPGSFTVVFRTSEDDVVGDGFEMYVLCYKPGEAILDVTSTPPPGKKGDQMV